MAVRSLGTWGYTDDNGKAYLGPIPQNVNERRQTLDSLAPQEKIFLLFEKQKILENIGLGRDIISLPSGWSESVTQEAFRSWLQENCYSQEFSAEELNVRMIVSSIWMKTKKICEALHLDAKDEKQRQAKADQMMSVLNKKFVFTSRQSVILLNTIIEECERNLHTLTLDSLTLPEKLFLSFEKESIDRRMRTNGGIMYFPDVWTDPKKFRPWVEKNHPFRQFSAKELDVIKIVFSIWEKTKKFCATHPDLNFEHEKTCQIHAEKAMSHFPKQVVFTNRQIVILSNTINQFDFSKERQNCENLENFKSETGSCRAVILSDAYGDF